MQITINIPDVPTGFSYVSIDKDAIPNKGDMFYNPSSNCWETVTTSGVPASLVARHAETRLLKEGWGLRYQGTGWDNEGELCHYVASPYPDYFGDVNAYKTGYSKSLPLGGDRCHYWELIPPTIPELDTTDLPKGWSVVYRGLDWVTDEKVFYASVDVGDTNAVVTRVDLNSPFTIHGASNIPIHYWELIPPVPSIDTTDLPKGWTVEYRGIGWKTDCDIYCFYVIGSGVDAKVVDKDWLIASTPYGIVDAHYWELIPPTVPTVDSSKLPDGWTVEYRGLGWVADDCRYVCQDVERGQSTIVVRGVTPLTCANGYDHYHYWELIPPTVPELDTANLPNGWTAEYRGTEWNNGGEPCYYTTSSFTHNPVEVWVSDYEFPLTPSGDHDYYYWELIPPTVPKLDTRGLPLGWTVEYRGLGWDNDNRPCNYVSCDLVPTIKRWCDKEKRVPLGDNATHYWEIIPSEEYMKEAIKMSMQLPRTVATIPKSLVLSFIADQPPVNKRTTIMDLVGTDFNSLVWLVNKEGYTKKAEITWEQYRGYLSGGHTVDEHAEDDIRWTNDPLTTYEDANPFVV